MPREISIIIFLIPFVVFGQFSDSIQLAEPGYYARIKYLDNTKSDKGYLIDIQEEGIVFARDIQYNSMALFANQSKPTTVPFTKIKDLSVYKTGDMGRHVWIGALSGGIAVGLLSVASNNSPCSGYFCIRFSNAEAFGIGFLPGALAGTLIGLVTSQMTNLRIPINGKYTEYKKREKKVQKYILSERESLKE